MTMQQGVKSKTLEARKDIIVLSESGALASEVSMNPRAKMYHFR